MQKTQKTFSCRRKNHPTPGTLSNQLSVTWETRRENLNLPGPVNYATQIRRPCPRTGIFFARQPPRRTGTCSRQRRSLKTRTHPRHALARAVEYTALGTGVRAEARPIAHFYENNFACFCLEFSRISNFHVFLNSSVIQIAFGHFRLKLSKLKVG